MMGDGIHLMIEGVAKRPPWIQWSVPYFCGAITRLIGIAGMTLIQGPWVHNVIDGEEKNDWVGFAILAESHVSFHMQGDRVWVDVFSCKPFQIDLLRREVENMFCLELCSYQVLKRGWTNHERG